MKDDSFGEMTLTMLGGLVDVEIDAHRVLRGGTRIEHERIEAHPLMTTLMTDQCDQSVLDKVVAAQLVFSALTEPLLRAAAPDCLRKHHSFAFRGGLVASPLSHIDGVHALIMADQTPRYHTNAHWLGYLYVVEGSTLGGAVIAKHLRSLRRVESEQYLAAFSPYENQTGLVWRAFLSVLAVQIRSAEEMDEAVKAARHTFDFHYKVLDAVMSGDADG